MAQSDSFVLWNSIATPVTELRSRNRCSNRSASFSRQQQDFGTLAASYASNIDPASRNASAFAGGSIGDFTTQAFAWPPHCKREF
ncbi:hypothetical protein MTO96_025625 [Rhipicephalus appendiculatus]